MASPWFATLEYFVAFPNLIQQNYMHMFCVFSPWFLKMRMVAIRPWCILNVWYEPPRYHDLPSKPLYRIACNTTTSPSPGGGVFNSAGTATLSGCNLISNSANSDGGGVFTDDAAVSLSDCNFISNLASLGGGVSIWLEASDAVTSTLSGCNFTSNSASEGGGGVYNSNAATLSDCNFISNAAYGQYAMGGGFVNDFGLATLTGCNFTSNSASYEGGGVQNLGLSTLSDCHFITNSALIGHAVYTNARILFVSCSFVGDYDDDACVIYAGVTLESYYMQSFSNGSVCYDGLDTVILYNNDVVTPLNPSFESDVLSCQSESISAYCTYDCAAGLGGLGIECR